MSCITAELVEIRVLKTQRVFVGVLRRQRIGLHHLDNWTTEMFTLNFSSFPHHTDLKFYYHFSFSQCIYGALYERITF